MRGSLWTLVVAAIGAAVVLRGAGTAVPSSPTNSTSATASVLGQTAPFASVLLVLAAIGALIILALRAT